MAVSSKGLQLLEALLGAPGRVLTKAELMRAAWGDTAVEESNLSVQIAALRKQLGPSADGGDWIANDSARRLPLRRTSGERTDGADR